jgi:hypothetical protein
VLGAGCTQQTEIKLRALDVEARLLDEQATYRERERQREQQVITISLKPGSRNPKPMGACTLHDADVIRCMA